MQASPLAPHDIYAQRRERVRARMRAYGLDTLLVRYASNRYYLSGFELHDSQLNESEGCLLLCSNGKDWLCTDARYAEAAARLWDSERILIYGSQPAQRIRQLVREHCQGSIGFEAETMPLPFFEAFSPQLALRRADGLVEGLRQIKDAFEIACIEQSCALNHQLMNCLPQEIATQSAQGGSEADLAWSIERFFREHGASELAFSSIVAKGVNAALPHARPSALPLGDSGSLLIDVGCRLHDYCSDQTRSFYIGTPNPQFEQTLAFVQEAQQAAIEQIRPDVSCADIFAAAWKSFEKHGVAAHFTHSLGHGVGLDTHEAPRLSARNTNVLKPGMVVTVEPGLYYPEWGGVRWEYMVLVTEEGCRVL